MNRKLYAQDYFTHVRQRRIQEKYKEAVQAEMLYDEKDKLRALYCAEAIMHKYEIITTMEDEQIYIYRQGVYEPVRENFIKKQIQNIRGIKEVLNNTLVSEILEAIKRETFESREEIDSEDNKHLLCLDNGVFNLKTEELQRHSPRHKIVTKFPVNYDPKADCPNFKRFLSEVLHDGDIEVMQEAFGFCLYRGMPVQKAFMFLGGGSNGKSVLLDVLIEFLGQENISSIALQTLEYNRFAKANLYGKVANIFPDLNSRKLKTTSAFKTLVAGDLVNAERKFRDGFKFRNYAKMFFSANELPKSDDETHAYMRRWVFFEFPNQFGEGGKEARPAEELLAEMTTAEELSGILNWALEGLKRLLDNGYFSTSDSAEDIKEQYLRMTNPMKIFVRDEVEKKQGAWISKSDLYAEYSEWCQEQEVEPEASNVFSKNIRRAIPGLKDQKKKTSQGRENVWLGIQVKGEHDREDFTERKIRQDEVLQAIKSNSMTTEELKAELCSSQNNIYTLTGMLSYLEREGTIHKDPNEKWRMTKK